MNKNTNKWQILSLFLMLFFMEIFISKGIFANQYEEYECQSKFKWPLYVGGDYQLNNMRFKKGYGDNIFPKHHPQINFYGGLKLDNKNSIELGYMSTISKTKYTTLTTGDSALGAPVPPGLSPVIFKSYIIVKGYHLNYVKIFSFQNYEDLKFLSSIGAAFLRINSVRNTISMSYPSVPGNIRYFNRHKVVLRLMAASEYKFNNSLGMRLSFCFLNTRILRIKANNMPSPAINKNPPTIKPKDSFIYSVGFFYDF